VECVCKGPGFCPQYQRTMSEREYKLCSCTCGDPNFCTPPLCERRRQRWYAQGKNGGPVPALAPTRTVPLEWVSTARLAADAVILASLFPPDVVGIVGVARSGMIPAATVAALLHLPLWELTADGLHLLNTGPRGLPRPDSRGRLAVVDDTVYSGTAMRRARGILGRGVCAAGSRGRRGRVC
jgi:hypothetical protein